jgi:hypothetical protein
LEQVHVRGIVCRGLRLKLVAGIGIALAMSAPAFAAQDSQNSETRGLSTQTSMTAQTRDQAGRTAATVLVNVTGEDGLPATGGVVISDHGMQVAGAALNAKGEADIVIALPAGDHSLAATYAGDSAHRPSVSPVAEVQAQVSGTPNFTVAVSPATLSLAPGQSGTVVASITPQNSAALTAPMFITMSCSGLPDEASCSFTPENLEILPNATAPLTSTMVILTQAASSASLTHPQSNSVAWAVLLPGTLSLGGLAWGIRRRAWLSRLSLLALVALVTSLGTTACNPRYYYLNHGPPVNPATPAGAYTINVTAQSSNGVTAITNSTTMSLTVQ